MPSAGRIVLREAGRAARARAARLVLLPFTVALLGGPELRAAPPAPDATPFTLKQAIVQAQRESPRRAGAAALEAGMADAARLAGRLRNPVLEVRSENWSPSTALPLDVWAVVTQPIELGGKRTIRREMADAEHGVAAAGLVLTDRQLTLQTAQLYFQALRARGVLATLTANRDGLFRLVDTMRVRANEGYVAESDLLRFEAEAARADIDMARATLDLSRSLDSLSAVVGGARRIDAMQLVDPDPLPPPTADETAIASALATHPEVVAASARVVRAERTLAFERALRLPEPAVSTGFKQTLGVGTMVFAVTTTIPLFDRNRTAVAAAVGEVQAAMADRDAIRARLNAEATTVVRVAQTLADRAARARHDLLEPAAGVRDAARAAFEEGTLDVLKLIDAQRVYGDVQRVALDLQLEALGAAVEARIALGQEPLP